MTVKNLADDAAAKVVVITFLVGLFPVAFVSAQFPLESVGSIAFTPQTSLGIPQNNASVNFAVSGVYTNATLKNGTWDFTSF